MEGGCIVRHHGEITCDESSACAIGKHWAYVNTFARQKRFNNLSL